MHEARRAVTRQPHSDDKTVTKKVTIRGSLLARALAQAASEGHFNLSLLISKALNLYLTLKAHDPQGDEKERAA